MARTPTALLSPADQERRRALRRMKGVALGALLAMAVVFAVAFAFQRGVGRAGQQRRDGLQVGAPLVGLRRIG